jgi:hypothetical protein
MNTQSNNKGRSNNASNLSQEDRAKGGRNSQKNKKNNAGRSSK